MSFTCAPRSDRLSPWPSLHKLLTDGETVVVDTRTHPKALILPVVVLVVTARSRDLPRPQDRQRHREPRRTGSWRCSCSCGGWSGRSSTWLTATYTITTKRLITREGLIARRGHDIPLMRISDVAYDQGILDRMLGCGTLVISDASTHGSVRLHDIPQVELVQRRLTELLGHSGGACQE